MTAERGSPLSQWTAYMLRLKGKLEHHAGAEVINPNARRS